MKTKPIGLYVHTPLCIRKCNYCDFCSYPEASVEWREKYIDTLCAEIDGYKDRNISVDTVFFGGGTPSLLTPNEFEKITSHINKSFEVLPEAEFTLEANPKTLTRENLSAYMSMGVNRLSIGVQSIHENELKTLGRIHNLADFLDSYTLARECGIKNINLDLMYGIPLQTKESFNKTLDTVISLSPSHLSLYGLILEEGTPFYDKRAALPLPSEDTECDMYYLALKKLKSAGYSHYEISNYAKPGYECRHNLKYWRDESYIGVGVSAYSYFNSERYGNSSLISEYLSENREKYSYREKIDRNDEAYEFVMLGLRLAEGISLSEYKSKFDFDFITSARLPIIKKYNDLCMLKISNDRLYLTDKGFYISNSILTDIL